MIQFHLSPSLTVPPDGARLINSSESMTKSEFDFRITNNRLPFAIFCEKRVVRIHLYRLLSQGRPEKYSPRIFNPLAL